MGSKGGPSKATPTQVPTRTYKTEAERDDAGSGGYMKALGASYLKRKKTPSSGSGFGGNKEQLG